MEYILAALALALALFAWHGGDRPEDRVLPVVSAGPYLHDDLDCLRSRDGLKLRLAIQHCSDGSPFERWCYHQCFYGSVDRRAAM